MISLSGLSSYLKKRSIKTLPEKLKASECADTIEKLRKPEWKIVEDYYKKKVNSSLKKYYETDLIFDQDFEIVSLCSKLPVGCHVSHFTAITGETTDGFFEGLENYIEIASGIMGGRYIIDPTLSNPKVYLHFWDVGRDPSWFQDTGLTLKQFFEAKRIVSDFQEDLEIYD